MEMLIYVIDIKHRRNGFMSELNQPALAALLQGLFDNRYMPIYL